MSLSVPYDDDGDDTETPFADTLPILRDEIAAFERAKRDEVRHSTWLTYERTLGQFVEFLVGKSVGELADIEPRHFRGFSQWLKRRGNESTTRRKKLKQLQTVLRDWAAFEGTPRRWIKDVDRAKPNVSASESSRAKEKVPTEKAKRIVDRTRFLAEQTLEPRELRNAAVLGIWMDTGARCCDLVSLDVGDFEDGDRPRLAFANREETGTRLKHGETHERESHLSVETADSIRLYLQHGRPEFTDAYGREPLLHSGGDNGNELKRITTKTLKDLSYGITRPCQYEGGCPIGKNPTECPYTTASKAISCPESNRPHAWRGTAANVMYYDREMRLDRIADCMAVGVNVLKKHYLDDPRADHLDEEWDEHFGSQVAYDGPRENESPQSRMTDQMPMSLAEELQRIANLHDEGELTDEEYDAAKRRLLEE